MDTDDVDMDAAPCLGEKRDRFFTSVARTWGSRRARLVKLVCSDTQSLSVTSASAWPLHKVEEYARSRHGCDTETVSMQYQLRRP